MTEHEFFDVHLIGRPEWLDDLLHSIVKAYTKNGFKLFEVSKPYPDKHYKNHMRIDAKFTHLR